LDALMSQTRPNKIKTITNSDAYNLAADLATFADSANVVIPVASQAERDALTLYAGLTVSRTDLGGVIEICDGTKWSKGLQHAEFTASTAPTVNTLWGPGPLSLDAANSTSYGFVTSPANDKIALGIGIYAISCRYTMSAAAAGTTWGAIVNDGNTATYTSFDVTAGYASMTVSLPSLYLPTAGNVRFTFISGTASGYTLTSRIRVSRIG
jgi:hypothetical protein